MFSSLTRWPLACSSGIHWIMVIAKRWAVSVCVLWVTLALAGCNTSPQANEAKYLKRGEGRLAKQDYARALLEYRNAAKAVPTDAEPYYQMGLVYLKSGDGQNAIRSFQAAIRLNPKHAGAQLELAKLMTATRDPTLIKTAAENLEKVFGAFPGNLEAVDTLALAEWKLGKPEEAAGLLEQALKKFPAHLQSSVALAQMKLSAGDWSGAEEVLKKAVADAPQSSQAEAALGGFYLFIHEPAKAEPALRAALKIDPKNGDALMSLAALQMSGNRLDEAEQTYKQLASLPEKTYRPLHAIFLYQTGKRDAAVREFEALAKSDPDDRAARTRLVAVYFAMNRVSDAEGVLAAALKRNPKDSDALLQRAEWRLRLGRVDDAEKDLRAVLNFSPDSAEAHFALAAVFKSQGLRNSQQEELQKALNFHPEMLRARLALAAVFLSENHAGAALEALDQAPASQKLDLGWILVRNWALLASGNVQQAKAGIDAALQQGRSSEALFQNAVLRFLQKDYAGSRSTVEELLKRGVADPNVAGLLMQVSIAQRQTAQGLERLKQMAAAHPNSAPLQAFLGQWYARTGDLKGARQAYESAAKADPQFTPADIALAQMDLQEGQIASARQKLNSVLAKDPKNTGALTLLAQTQHETGDTREEINTYRAILAVDGSNLTALNNLAYVLAPSSTDEALKFAQQAAQMAPDEPSVEDTLGWIYYRKGLYSMAVPHLKKAVDKASNPVREFHLGMCYLKSGNPMGQKMVNEALQKAPNLAATEKAW